MLFLVGMLRMGRNTGIAGGHLAMVGETLRFKAVPGAQMLGD